MVVDYFVISATAYRPVSLLTRPSQPAHSTIAVDKALRVFCQVFWHKENKDNEKGKTEICQNNGKMGREERQGKTRRGDVE